MTEDHARSILGVSDHATDAEISSAYRRLMQTVHPDVCKGPEAERLTRDAAQARAVLAKKEPPSPDSRTSQPAPSPAGSPASGERELERAVIELLNRTGPGTTVTRVMIEIMYHDKHLPAEHREAWALRLTAPEFWRSGHDRGLWRVEDGKLSPAATAGAGNSRRESSRTAGTQPGRGPSRPGTFARPLTAEWIGAIAITAGMAAIAGLLVAGISDMWTTGGGNATIFLGTALLTAGTVHGLLKWLDARNNLPENNMTRYDVLIPGMAAGVFMLWRILTTLE